MSEKKKSTMNPFEMKKTDNRLSIIRRRGYRKDIKGDKFSLYISNYPVVVEYLKERIGNQDKVLAELCCSVGITLEYIASNFKHVIGVDIDKKILANCKKNLENTGLSKHSTLLLGDINQDSVLKKIKADIAIYDIPFWAPHKYKHQGDLIEKNPLLKATVERIRKLITSDIVVFCPPFYSYQDIKSELGPCEFQKVFINKKHNRNHVYLGSLKTKNGISSIHLET